MVGKCVSISAQNSTQSQSRVYCTTADMQIAQNGLNGAQFSVYFQLFGAATKSTSKSEQHEKGGIYVYIFRRLAFDFIFETMRQAAAPNSRLTGAFTPTPGRPGIKQVLMAIILIGCLAANRIKCERFGQIRLCPSRKSFSFAGFTVGC